MIDPSDNTLTNFANMLPDKNNLFEIIKQISDYNTNIVDKIYEKRNKQNISITDITKKYNGGQLNKYLISIELINKLYDTNKNIVLKQYLIMKTLYNDIKDLIKNNKIKILEKENEKKVSILQMISSSKTEIEKLEKENKYCESIKPTLNYPIQVYEVPIKNDFSTNGFSIDKSDNFKKSVEMMQNYNERVTNLKLYIDVLGLKYENELEMSSFYKTDEELGIKKNVEEQTAGKSKTKRSKKNKNKNKNKKSKNNKKKTLRRHKR